MMQMYVEYFDCANFFKKINQLIKIIIYLLKNKSWMIKLFIKN
jgi:hypothetical protein